MPTPTATLFLAFDPNDSQTAPYGRFLKGSSTIRSKTWQLANFTGYSVSSASINNAGSGYALRDVITAAGTYVAPAQFKVKAVTSTGAISAIEPVAVGNLYSAALSQPQGGTPTTGGSGRGATLTLVVAPVANSPITVPDSKETPILLSKASGAIVLVQVQLSNSCVLTNGLDDGNALQVSAVFGRGHHSTSRDQKYASPFAIPGSTNVCCTFFQGFKAAGSQGNWTLSPNPRPGGYTYDNPGNNQAYLYIGAPAFLDADGLDLYEFNVGVVACTSNGVFTFGHDPDMQVDN